jgi:hypothetical protein|tara:strand:- start:1179 stop:1376 length:198 start_codon:yes stop_codon:yes gene_type:complete
MSKNNLNEGVSKFIGAFFDNVSRNTTNRFLKRAEKRGMPKPVLDKLAKIKKESDELDALLKKYSK